MKSDKNTDAKLSIKRETLRRVRTATRFISVMGVLGLVTTAFAAGADPIPASPATPPPTANPTGFYIFNVSETGSGCPQGSANVTVTPDGSELDIGFTQFVADAPDVVTKERSHCLLTFGIHVPQGWTFAVIQADYNGFAQLDRSVTARQQTSYFLAGNPAITSTLALTSDGWTKSLSIGALTLGSSSGPDDYSTGDTYTISDTIPVEAVVFNKCGSNVIANVSASISVQNAGATSPNNVGYIEFDEADFTANLVWHLQWKTCF
jgi:hypothetical protein